MKKIIWIAGAVLGVVIIASFLRTPSVQSDSVKVAATIFPLYDIAHEVAGDDAEVSLLLPPGASPHFYEFSPLQLKELQGVSAIFAIGYGVDDWAHRVEGAIEGAKIVTVDTGIALKESVHEEEAHEDEAGEEEEHGPTDPHYWLDMSNARRIAVNIADTLSKLDADNAAAYQARANAYAEKLTLEEGDLKQRLEPFLGREIITLHDAWYYFADSFGLSIAATFEPTAGEDPTAQDLKNLEQLVQLEKVSVIFTEAQLDSLALNAFAKNNKLGIAPLDEVGGVEGRENYIDLMRYNVGVIIDAFNE